jgi:tetratricopeptide (TPR) repeat protein
VLLLFPAFNPPSPHASLLPRFPALKILCTFAPQNLKHQNMKKLILLLPSLLILFACQTKQEPAKTGTVPAQENKQQTLVVEGEKPIPASGLKDAKPPSNDTKNVSTLIHRAQELIKSKNYEEAIEYLNRAMELDAKNARIPFFHGMCYFYMKDYDNALSDFNKSLTINPSDTEVILNTGLAKYYKNDLQGAMKDYTNAISKSKRFSEAYYNRGLVKGLLKDYKGSVDDFTQAIIFKPTYPEAYYNRGLANFYKKDTMNACFDWIQANRMGSPNAQKAIDLYCEKWNH